MNKALLVKAIIAGAALLSLAIAIDTDLRSDAVAWPTSAHARIEAKAQIIRKIEGPARWCSSSSHPANIENMDDDETRHARARACMAKIEPVSDFIERHANEYMLRFYRADLGDEFCEATLSHVWNDERIVGSDCYYGLFKKEDDEGIGMTDDPFG